MERATIIQSGSAMEQKIKMLKEVKVDVEKWEVYYIDERTGEKWIEEHPYPEMQAGGPPQLRLIDKFPWE